LTTFARFAEILRDDVIPLLMEYCYEDFDALEKILGPGLVQRQTQRINESLFDASRLVELKDTLLAAFDTITATSEAVEAAGDIAGAAEEGEDSDEEPGEGSAESPGA
jgi:5-methylcytosine-specific restriction protein B